MSRDEARATADRGQVLALAHAFRLNWGRFPLAGRVGERLGSAAGASTEFHDYRPYVPGDDLRYVDWKAFARSDILTIRLFREEIAPRIDLVVDGTSSMTITEEKQARFQELVLLFGVMATESRASLKLIGDGAARRVPDPLSIAITTHTTRASQEPWPQIGGDLRWRSVRVVLSDFLFPHDPARLVRTLARDAGRLFLIQLNTPDEIDPAWRGPYRFVEIEDETNLDIQIGATEVARYRRRFAALTEGLAREAARAHALYCNFSTGLNLKETARELVRAGFLEAP